MSADETDVIMSGAVAFALPVFSVCRRHNGTSSTPWTPVRTGLTSPWRSYQFDDERLFQEATTHRAKVRSPGDSSIFVS